MDNTLLRTAGVTALLAFSACEEGTGPKQPDRLQPVPAPAYTITTGAELKDSIENAGTGAVINIPTGDYYLPSQILIDAKTNLTIRGQGIGVTRIHASDTAMFVFKVGDNVSQLSVSDMTIIGNGPSVADTHGIGMFSGTNRSGLYFERLELKDLNVGISVAGSAALQTSTGSSGCYDVTIFQNTFVGIFARQHPDRTNFPPPNSSGSGYAIHNQGCHHVRIAENYIEGTERHGIYEAWSKGPVTIEHNFILNHLKNTPDSLQAGDQNLVAIAVTNTEDAAVAFNTVMNSYSDAISIEYENASSRPASTSNVQLIGNQIVGSRTHDLFVSAPGTWQIWGNKYHHRGSIGATTTPTLRDNGQSYSLDTATTSSSGIWSRWWGTKDVTAATPGSDVYVFQNDYLHKVTKSYFSHPDSWTYTSYKGPYYGMQALAVDSTYAYVMASNSLYALTTAASPWTERTSPTNWSGFEAMTVTGGQLYIIQSGYLHHVDPATFSYASPTPRAGWQNAQALIGFKGRLFIFQGDCVHDVSTSTLWYTRYWC